MWCSATTALVSPTLIETTDPGLGADDSITAGDGNNTVLGGDGVDSITSGAGNDIVLGDHGSVTAALIQTTDPGFGAGDVITAGDGNNTILGGDGVDSITSGAGNDIVIGDHGSVTAALIQTTNPTFGGSDTISVGGGDDIILAGALGDIVSAGAGNDVIVGDHGWVVRGSLLQISSADPTVGGPDTIDGGAGNDIVLAGTAADVVSGDAGNDLIFGDHGQVDGNIDLDPAAARAPSRASVQLDVDRHVGDRRRRRRPVARRRRRRHRRRRPGRRPDHRRRRRRRRRSAATTSPAARTPATSSTRGSGNDWVAGDNADLLRTGSSSSPRFQVLASDAICDLLGNSQAIGGVRRSTRTRPTRSAGSGCSTTRRRRRPGPMGDDVIAGGADDDVIFGQLGNDWLQGDGSIDRRHRRDHDRRRRAPAQSIEDWAGPGTRRPRLDRGQRR